MNALKREQEGNSMAVFVIGGIVVGAGVLAFSVIRGKKSREKVCYDCGKYAAEVAEETGDKEQGLKKGKEEMLSEGIHHASTTLRNCMSFRQGFEEHYQPEPASSLSVSTD